MLSCKDITEHASDYIDGKAGLYKRLQYKLHLLMCLNCRRFVDQFRITVDSIKGLQPAKVEKEAVDSQVERLMREMKKDDSSQ